MKKFLWSIPVIGIYFYTLTVMSMLGYVTHFGIPASFIETSLRANIIYFFTQFKEFWIIAGNISAMSWVVIGGCLLVSVVFILAVLYFLAMNRFVFNISMFFAGIAVFILAILGFNKLGGIRASNQLAFLVPSQECGYERSVVPIIYEGQAVFVPIGEDNKMSGGFFVKNISEMDCELVPDMVGIITTR